MTMNSMKVMGSATAPAAVQASDKFGAIGARLVRESVQAVSTAIKAAGGSNAELQASARLKNVLEGMVSLTASWFDPRLGRVVASVEAPVAGGAVSLDVKALLASAVEKKHEPVVSAEKKYVVDPAKLAAKRVGSLIVLSHAALPEWGLHVSMADVKAGREAVEERIAASIQGFCASMFGRNADIPGGLKMPLVASELPAQPAAEQAAPAAAEHPELAAEQAALAAASPTSKDTGGKIDASAGASRAWETNAALMGSLNRQAADAASAFVRNILKGGLAAIKGVDLTGIKVSASKVEGSAVVSVEFFGNRSSEQATIEVPFDANGKAVQAGVGRTKADIVAAEELRRSLEIASEAEAKAIFEKFVADQAAKEIRAEQLGINISATSEMGYGANWIKRGPADRIPIPKHALPEEFSVVGKKILLGGMVYELQPTDYNAPSIERSAHWMLELRMEIPASKADYAYGFGGLGQSLASAGF